MSDARVVVVMGVSGVGKTTVGRRLAGRLGWTFIDADDYHAEVDVAKMRSGIGLTDADRRPWLARLGAILRERLAEGDATVLACSALRRSYREALRGGDDRVAFLYLEAARDLVRARLERREGHFAGATLLKSQFATLEAPSDALIVDAGQPLDDLVDAAEDAVRRWLEAEKERDASSGAPEPAK